MLTMMMQLFQNSRATGQQRHEIFCKNTSTTVAAAQSAAQAVFITVHLPEMQRINTLGPEVLLKRPITSHVVVELVRDLRKQSTAS